MAKKIVVGLLVVAFGITVFLLRTSREIPPGTPENLRVQTARPPTAPKRIAVIIDDAGYNLNPCNHLKDIKQPVAISILPSLTYSKSIAYCAHNAHKEIFLHLPMESYERVNGYPQGYLITEAMSPGKIMNLIETALASIPFVEGVNNHMGSRITENKKIMRLIFAQLKGRGLFFVDSLVTDRSVCPEVAKEINLPFAQRDIFLDNKSKRAYIEGQFHKLAEEAQAKGYALGIGHARDLTFEILKEQFELLTQRGFEIVEVKDILLRP